MRFGMSIPPTDPSAGGDAMGHTYEWCQRAEELGFDFGAVGHHRFTPGYDTSPWVTLAAIAAQTSNLRLGTAIFLLPLDHPLTVAEAAATLDVVSGGRVFMGAGLGYRRYEWDALNLPYEARARRLDECLEIVEAAWTEERVSHHGEHFHFDDVPVLPKPIQDPRPPIWLGANSAAGIRRASQRGDAWIVGFGDRMSTLAERVDRFRTDSRNNGRAGDICLMRLVGIGATERQVDEEWVPTTMAMLRGYRRAGAPGERAAEVADQRHLIDELRQDLFVAGTPERVIEGIRRAHEVTGCEYFYPSFSRLDHDSAWEALELFGREVIPAFR